MHDLLVFFFKTLKYTIAVVLIPFFNCRDINKKV